MLNAGYSIKSSKLDSKSCIKCVTWRLTCSYEICPYIIANMLCRGSGFYFLDPRNKVGVKPGENQSFSITPQLDRGVEMEGKVSELR